MDKENSTDNKQLLPKKTFTDLPAELRNEIYGYMLKNEAHKFPTEDPADWSPQNFTYHRKIEPTTEQDKHSFLARRSYFRFTMVNCDFRSDFRAMYLSQALI